MVYLLLSHSQKRGAFCLSADGTIAYCYWVKHPVLLDLRPADCVTTSASNTGCFAMSKKNGKPCRRCGGHEWYKNGSCAACAREGCRKWREVHRSEVNEYRRQRYRENPERDKEISNRWRQKNPERYKESYQRWKRNNPERTKITTANWRRLNADRVRETKRESVRRWRQKNPDGYAAQHNRRRTNETAAGGGYTTSEWRDLVAHYGGKCLCCGRTDLPLTADHVIPVAKGGSSHISNMQPLCGGCNSKKGTKAIDYRPDAGPGRWIQRKLFGE